VAEVKVCGRRVDDFAWLIASTEVGLPTDPRTVDFLNWEMGGLEVDLVRNVLQHSRTHYKDVLPHEASAYEEAMAT
jgi:hypothetical protein